MVVFLKIFELQTSLWAYFGKYVERIKNKIKTYLEIFELQTSLWAYFGKYVERIKNKIKTILAKSSKEKKKTKQCRAGLVPALLCLV